MKHKALFRVGQDCDTAVLFIHGILGTPDHFEKFIPLVPEEYSVVNLLLDGHGGSVEDFSRTSMEKWKKQVTDTVNALAENHSGILIVAHSMGCLFAIEQAIRNSQQVKGLFLLAAPMKLFLKPALVGNSMRVYLGKVNPDNPRLAAAHNTYGIENDKHFWRYFGWIPRFLELFQEICQVRGMLLRLTTPCCCFQSRKDEMVSVKSVQVLKTAACVQIQVLKNSSHFYYEESDFRLLLAQFSQWLTHKGGNEYV